MSAFVVAGAASLTVCLVFIAFTLTEGCFSVVMTTAVYIKVLKKYDVIVGADDGLYFFKVGFFCCLTFGETVILHFLFLLVASLNLSLTRGFALAVELLELGFLSVGEIHAGEGTELLAAILFVGLLTLDALLFCFGCIVVRILSHTVESCERHGDKC